MKVYTVAIGNFSFPITKDQIKILQEIKEMDGFVGLTPCYPDGTLLLFETKNDAIGGKNILDYLKVNTGRNIGEVFIDDKYKRQVS